VLVDLDKVRRSWSMVLEEIRKRSKRLHAMLADATVTGFEADTLSLEARFDFHAKQLMETKNARMIAEAFNAVLGASPKILGTVRAQTDGDDDEASDASGDPLDIVKAGFGDDVVEE
jgi:hypothetical protein